MPSPASSCASSASTTAGTRPSTSSAKATEPPAPPSSSNILENDKDIDLNGVILLSQIFNFDLRHRSARRGNPGIDLPYETALPTYAATAWYHHKLPNQPPSLEPFLKQVEQFAMGDYAHALAAGTDLRRRQETPSRKSCMSTPACRSSTSCSANLRVSGGEFTKNLQMDNDLTTGRLDTRFSGPTIDPLAKRPNTIRKARPSPRPTSRCSTITFAAT